MKRIALIGAATLLLGSEAAVAQSNSIRVAPGHFCAIQKCVRFSQDLSAVSIQGRRPVSVQSYGLRNNPVISADTYREIFRRALVQPGVNGNRG